MSATTSCPVCGSEIHAIAGRCKHCKTDLLEHRSESKRQSRSVNAERAAEPATPAPAADATKQPPSKKTPRTPRTNNWSRRWPYVVSVIALLAIGVSVGMMAERWRTGDEEASPQPLGSRSISRTPHMVPDQMPSPVIPPPTQRPVDPLLLPPLSPPSLQNPWAPKLPNQSQLSAERFASEITDSLCSKLTQCGIIDSSTRRVCEIFASQLDDEEAAARVRTGECTFDEQAAERCIKAIDKLSCDFGSNGDMALDWLLTASSLQACTKAYICR